MSARRYSGNATITVTIDESARNYQPGRQSYRVTVAQGRQRETMNISAPIVHGSGVGIDSPRMIDDVARSGLAFATDGRDAKIDDNTLDFDDKGFVVSRRKRS